jgi:hypothetical protein
MEGQRKKSKEIRGIKKRRQQIHNKWVVNDYSLSGRIKKGKSIVVFGAAWDNQTQVAIKALFYGLRHDYPKVRFLIAFIELNDKVLESDSQKRSVYANFDMKVKYDIKVYPTVITFKGGKEWERSENPTAKELVEMMEKLNLRRLKAAA